MMLDGRDDAMLVAVDADRLRLVAGVLDDEAFDVEDDVGHVFDDAGDRADLVLHALDFDAGDGTAFEAGQQDAADAVAHGDAEAVLEGFGVELAVGVGQCRAITTHAVG